jgi:curved DNA-binding protein CbpA
MANYYEILGIGKDASVGDVRKAYASIAKERHPDRFSDPVERERAQEFFKDATAAFNALSSERSRREYDAQLAKPIARTPEEQAQQAYAEAQEHMKRSDAVAAAESLRQAAYLAPSEARYQAALGRVLARDPRTAREATHALEEATRLDPANAQAFLDLALVYQSQGLTLRARKAAETAHLLAPADPAIARLHAELSPAPDPGSGKEGGLRGFLRRKA